MSPDCERLAIEGGPAVITSPLPTIKNASGRLIGQEELRLVSEVIQSGTLGSIYGTRVSDFEQRFAELLGAKYGLAVSSGTAALHTAMIYLNPDPGDEILVSPITDMGSVIPILYQQAVPVFVDIDPLNQNMNPGLIEAQISSRTRAIMVTHIFGGPADMDPLLRIAARHNLFVIEDCAQAHLATYRGRPVGTLGHMGCFSFQQSKHITTGDGGMVVSDQDERFGRALRLCADKGWPRDLPRRDHCFLAPNYHMTELQAAVGLAQIEKYPQCLAARRQAAAELDACMEGEEIVTPVGTLPECEHSYFYYCFRVDLTKMRADGNTLVRSLIAEGLPCELGYPGSIPLYLYDMIHQRETFGASGWPFTSPAARKRWEYPQGLCPEAERACRETIVLPWNEGLRSSHVRLIAAAVRKVIAGWKA